MKNLRVLAVLLLSIGMAAQVNAQLDTTGLSTWPQMFNSMASWEEGAFGANATDHPDYGWGLYSNITHGVTGDSLFIIKLQDGTYKQLWIVEKSGASVYKFRYTDLDGSNEKEATIDMKDHANSHFVYYNIRTDSAGDEQPASANWDLLLTKFTHTGINYSVTGFLANDGVEVSVLNAADSTTAADATLADTTEFTDSISAIGNSWYKLQGMSIVPLDTIAYFIKTADGEIYKMQVTFFESGFSGLGRVGIRIQHFVGTTTPAFVHDTLVMGSMYADEVYYSLPNGSAGKTSRSSWDIGFKSGTFTSSIITNSTMGVELYTYPKGDISDWYSVTSITPASKVNGGIGLYPNPASGLLNVKMNLETKTPVNINVFDLTGKSILQRTVKTSGLEEFRLDVSGLHPGVYMLQVRNREINTVRKFSIR